LGGGTLPRVLQKILPDAQIDAVEVDPAVVRVAYKYFDFKPGPQTRVFEEDGRVFAKRMGRRETRYDLVMLDAFDHEYIPEHLLTREFLLEIKGLLTEHGVLAANTFASSRLYDFESATYFSVFGDFYRLKRPPVISPRRRAAGSRGAWAQCGQRRGAVAALRCGQGMALPLFAVESGWPKGTRLPHRPVFAVEFAQWIVSDPDPHDRPDILAFRPARACRPAQRVQGSPRCRPTRRPRAPHHRRSRAGSAHRGGAACSSCALATAFATETEPAVRAALAASLGTVLAESADGASVRMPRGRVLHRRDPRRRRAAAPRMPIGAAPRWRSSATKISGRPALTAESRKRGTTRPNGCTPRRACASSRTGEEQGSWRALARQRLDAMAERAATRNPPTRFSRAGSAGDEAGPIVSRDGRHRPALAKS
jgi:hypothetical protein